MKVFYVHHTPLAGLAALGRSTTSGQVSASLTQERSNFLTLRENFMYTGKDPKGQDVYGIWIRADQLLLPRLISSFCDLLGVPETEYQVCQVPINTDFRLRLVTLAYQLGFYGLARRLVIRLGRAEKSLVPRLAGVD